MRPVKPPSRARRRPLYRRLRRGGIWIGLPLLLAGTLFGAVQFARQPAGQALLQHAGDRLIEGTASLGLTVTDIRVEGRETTDRATVLSALAAGQGTPILAVSPSRAKSQLESLPWVRSAVIERRLPDTLYVRLVERKPLALWQHGGKIELIDREGLVIPVTRLDQFARLPMVVGEDAAAQAKPLIDMLATQPDLANRVTAAVRVGGRRWNLRIDNAIEVDLPEQDAAGAWAKLGELEKASGVLKRDVQLVDMRLSDRLVIRAAPEPAKDVKAKDGLPKDSLTKKPRPQAKST